MKFLKRARVLVSLAFFSAFAVLFSDITFSLHRHLSEPVTFFQFVPSLLKFLSIGGIAATGFIFVTGLTLVFGRVYCSFLCPMGGIQDIIAFFRKKIKKNKYAYKLPFAKTRYAILAGVTVIFLSGSVMGFTLLDPYSNFGRLFTHLVNPIIKGANNILVFTLAEFNIYTIHPVDFKGMAVFPFLYALAILAVILWMSVFHGRLFCNTLCPVGTFLGILSRFSILKIKFNTSRCINCKACEKVCKAACMDVANAHIDFSRCVACYNCLKVCPTSAVSYQSRSGISDKPVDVDSGKRDFILQTAAFVMTSTASAAYAQQQIEIYKNSTVPVLRKSGITPPGSQSLKHLTRHCTACHLCVTACPTQVLQPAFLEYGLSGIMQPRMDYKTSFCNYDCTICTTVCPTGAILPQPPETKKLIQLGKAEFIRKNCVVYTQKTDCGACAEHCPTKAVRMTLDPDINKKAPKIDDTICVGCGACEFACPTKPYKAIYVKSNPIHLTAEKPKQEKIEEQMDLKEDFPF